MKNYKIIKNKIELESLELSSLTTKIKDGTHSSFKDSNNKDSKILYSAKNIKNSNIIEGKNERRISLEDYKKIVNNGFPKKGDILLTIVGTIGESMIWNKEHSEAFQRSVAFIRCNNLIIPEYLKYAFKSNYLKNDISRRIKVGAQPGIYLKDLAKLKIKITTISQQKRIAEVLSKQESIINKTKNLIEQLEKRNTFMLDELLSGRLRIKEENGQVEFYKNPDDSWKTVIINFKEIPIPSVWNICDVNKIFKVYRGKVISKEHIKTNQGEYPVYSSATLNDGCIGKINTYMFDGEYITWNTDGYAGAVFYRNGRFNCTNICGILEPLNKIEGLESLKYLLANEFKKFVRTGAQLTNKKLMSNVVEKIQFVMPERKEMIHITNFLKNLDSEKEKYEKLLIEEQKKFDFLLEELMSGRLRIEE